MNLSKCLLIAVPWILAASSIVAQEPSKPPVDAAPRLTTWQVDGVQRQALIWAPASADKQPTPLVFVFHGHGGRMGQVMKSFALHERWPAAIVVYPQGLNTPGALTDPEGKKPGWQRLPEQQADRDLKFFDAMMVQLKQDYQVDALRIYATGHSNGASFTYLLAATRGDVWAAIAPSASSIGPQLQRLIKPVPTIILAGEQDQLVKFEWQTASIEFFRKLNQCSEQPTIEGWLKSYSSEISVPFQAYIHPGGHRFAVEAVPSIVAFFQAQSRAVATSSDPPPRVYEIEHTGAMFPAPVLPALDELPSIAPLPDPLLWSDGSGRATTFGQWSRRRAEIKAEIEHYEIGEKPMRPEKITASYANGLLTVQVTVNNQTLTLTSVISLPSGEGPFPAVIGIGRGSGSLPADIFAGRHIAMIAFDFRQVMSHTQRRGNEPINQLYPELTHLGAYSAWSWGVSRLIDGLELVKHDLPIDLRHLAVTGCSFAGKMALFAGAFDERIALTIAQEPGGGGAAAWRVSETLGKVETLGATSRAWFREDMFQFSGRNVVKLPMDHHELVAMVAPRALLVLGNPDMVWLADESGYVSCRAAHEVWKQFGIGDRFGFSLVAGHRHCQLPGSQRPEVEAFVDKFLLDKANANTNVTISPYGHVDYSRWIQWWGHEKPTFPK